MAQTRKAIASTASKTADWTKSTINNAQIGEKTKAAMANIKEKTGNAKNAVIEKASDVKLKASLRYRSFVDKDEGEGDTGLLSSTSSSSLSSTSGNYSPRALPQPDSSVDIVTTRVFGVPVEVACERSCNYHQFMPDVVYKCLAYLYEKGIKEEGIFRLSGSATTIQQLRSQFDQGHDADFSEIYDPHAISGLLKLYLRELPTSLVPGNVCSGADKFEDLKRKIEELPDIQRCLLAHLMRLLQEISRNDAVTKMTVNNLVIIFVPTLSCSSDIAHLMISHADEVFATELMIPFGPSLVHSDINISEGDSSMEDAEVDSACVEF